jgi:hypothetical protein
MALSTMRARFSALRRFRGDFRSSKADLREVDAVVHSG